MPLSKRSKESINLGSETLDETRMIALGWLAPRQKFLAVLSLLSRR